MPFDFGWRHSTRLLGPRASRPPAWNATVLKLLGSTVTRVNPLLEAGETPAVPVNAIRLTQTIKLPNLATLRFLTHHCVAGFALKRLGKLRHIRERTVDPEPRKRMRVRLRLKSHPLGRVFLSPHLRPT